MPTPWSSNLPLAAWVTMELLTRITSFSTAAAASVRASALYRGAPDLADRCTVSALELVMTLRSQTLYELSLTLDSSSPPGASTMVWAAPASSLPADNRLCTCRFETDQPPCG